MSAYGTKQTFQPVSFYVQKVQEGIKQIEDSSSALLQDFNYALLCSQPVAEMVIDVVVGTELLRQANVDERRFDLAASWVNRKMLEVEGRAKRIGEVLSLAHGPERLLNWPRND